MGRWWLLLRVAGVTTDSIHRRLRSGQLLQGSVSASYRLFVGTDILVNCHKAVQNVSQHTGNRKVARPSFWPGEPSKTSHGFTWHSPQRLGHGVRSRGSISPTCHHQQLDGSNPSCSRTKRPDKSQPNSASARITTCEGISRSPADSSCGIKRVCRFSRLSGNC